MPENRSCWLCGRNGAADPLERHHIFGGPNRRLSERYGLVVYLCGNRCHRLGKYAVHQCADTRITLRQWGQRKLMKERGWSRERFMSVFGKNYLSNGEEDDEI